MRFSYDVDLDQRTREQLARYKLHRLVKLRLKLRCALTGHHLRLVSDDCYECPCGRFGSIGTTYVHHRDTRAVWVDLGRARDFIYC